MSVLENFENYVKLYQLYQRKSPVLIPKAQEFDFKIVHKLPAGILLIVWENRIICHPCYILRDQIFYFSRLFVLNIFENIINIF